MYIVVDTDDPTTAKWVKPARSSEVPVHEPLPDELMEQVNNECPFPGGEAEIEWNPPPNLPSWVLPDASALKGAAGSIEVESKPVDGDFGEKTDPDAEPLVNLSETMRAEASKLQLPPPESEIYRAGTCDEGDPLFWIAGKVMCYVQVDKESKRCWWFKPGMQEGCPAHPPLQLGERVSILFPLPPPEFYTHGRPTEIVWDESTHELVLPDWVFEPSQSWVDIRYESGKYLAWDKVRGCYIIAEGNPGAEVTQASHCKPGQANSHNFPTTPPDPSALREDVHVNIPFPPPELGFDGTPTQITFTNTAARPRIPEWMKDAAALSGPLTPPHVSTFDQPLGGGDPAQTAIIQGAQPPVRKGYRPDWKDDPIVRYRITMDGIRGYSSRAPRNPFTRDFWGYWWTRFAYAMALIFWFCYKKVANAFYFLHGGLYDIFGSKLSKAAILSVAVLVLLLAVGVTLYATYDRNPKPSKPKKVFSGKPMKVTVPKAKKASRDVVIKPIKHKSKKKPPAMQRPKPVMQPTMALPPTPTDPPDAMDMDPDPPPAMRKRRRRRRPASMRTRRRQKPRPMRKKKSIYLDFLK
ncbi:hypothetical protein ACFL3C_00065 [Patescibacteria group bacterium]